jgi:hypothetical protein
MEAGDRFTQALIVMLLPIPWSANVALLGAETYAAPGTFAPGNSSALLPFNPAAHTGESSSVPVLPFPLLSATVAPAPSLNGQLALKPLVDTPVLFVMLCKSALEVLPPK